MAHFVGIDYSSRKVAVFVIDGVESESPVSTFSFSAPKREVGLRATKSVLDAFSNWAMGGWLLDARVVIESPIMGGNGNARTAIMMAMTAGALLQSSLFYGARSVELAAPSSWKKNVCGDGSLHKQAVSDWLRETHAGLFLVCDTDDDTDAACLALYAAIEEEG
jgi:Holliday junction resolvasome RuvABC endonuclease subunit